MTDPTVRLQVQFLNLAMYSLDKVCSNLPKGVYYAQLLGKLSNFKKELIPVTIFHLRMADILKGD